MPSHGTRERDAEQSIRNPAAHNRRLAGEAAAALESLLTSALRNGNTFYGRVAIEVTIQGGRLCHVKEVLERTRK